MKSIIKPITGLLGLAVMISMASCENSGKLEQKSEEHDTHSEAIEITAEQMQTVGIELGTIEMKNLNSIVRANGQLVLPPQNEAAVNSLTSGIVREITVTEGTAVRKGQTVALLENLDIVKIQENYLTAKQDVVFSEQEYERQKTLSTQNAGTGKVFQQAQAKYEADKARLKSLETQLCQLDLDINAISAGNFAAQIPIKSPINGIICEIYIKTGSYTDMQTTLMEITDNSQIQCDLQIFEKDFPKIKQGQTVEIGLTNRGNKSIRGTVYRINQSFKDDSKSIAVHVKIDRPDTEQLLPGMYVSGLISVGNQMVKAVPANAIASAEGKQYIFLLDGEKEAEHFHFRKIEVVTGVSELGYVEITPMETLPDDARIITKGAFYVMSMASGEEEHDEH